MLENHADEQQETQEAQVAQEAQVLQPPTWARSRGYANGISVHSTGRLVFISGQIGWDEQCRFQSSDFVSQVRQTLQNVLTVLAEAGGKPEHLVRLTWYIVDKQEYLARGREIGSVYRELMGSHYPTMSVVQVAGLLEDMARVEIEATAMIP